MEVFVKFNDGQKMSEMELKGAPHGAEINVIFGFFEALGVTKPTPIQNMGGYKQESPGVKEVPKQKVAAAPIEAPATKKPAPGVYTKFVTEEFEMPPLSKNDRLDDMIENALRPSKPRALPMIGSENRAQFPVEEIARVSPSPDKKVGTEAEPGHWVTGIKVSENGGKRYKCRYWCECGYKSNIYIPLGQEFVSCYECSADMFIEPATKTADENGVPTRDQMGNFFIANHQ
ncbi:hypothetical protein [Sporosarcina sp. FSL K6-1508]|uniref:hypothetical protein n=1 Tax=Sporosarcina sp. FSL K6-1508 TaxID=2921553 RepID=UPI0030F71D2E